MRTLRLAVVACALALSTTACSVILSTAEPTQCTTTRDCDANPAFRNRVCEEGFCVIPRARIEPVSNDAGEGCVSSELCTQANSNKASVCAKAGGPCTPWQTEQCPFVAGAWSDPNAIVIGTILPFSVKQADGRLPRLPYVERVRRAIDLGLDELTTAVPGGLAAPGGGRRPFAVLHCDSYFDEAATRAAMTHLTDVVGAQAIILGGDEELAAVTPKAIEKQTAIVCSDCTGPLPPGPLAWRIVPPLALEAPMAAWRIADLETTIKSGPTPPAAIKVAVLTEEPGRGPAAFIASLVAKLRFNGKTVAENGANFTIVKAENPLKQSVNHVAHAETIATFAPDVLVVAMGADFPKHYVQLIESKWSVGKAKPYYVMTDLNYEVAPFVSVLGPGDEDLRKRISGTRPGFDPALQANIDAYTIRYKQAYNFLAPDGNHSGYDAFYVSAFGIAGALIQPIFDGPRISAGIERLRGGTLVDFRPESIGLALALLGQPTAKLDARGLWSSLDWNLATRDLETDVSMYCFQRDTDGALVAKPDAGPRLTTSTGAVTGTFTCD
jgi:hypothetical protein